jgi:uncharacterized tellurite resistance protein B-like protein
VAKKKKSDAGSLIGACLIGFLALFAAVPKEVWIAFGVAIVAWLVYFIYAKLANSQDAKNALSKTPVVLPTNGAHVQISKTELPSYSNSKFASRALGEDEPVSVPLPAPLAKVSGHKIPPAPKGLGLAVWIPSGEAVNVAGVSISGGMIYVGTSLKTPYGANDPSLIDPSLSINSYGDCTEQLLGYWPSYASLSSTARRAYINWLLDGRREPNADIGYVFLFFYGLERRVIIDALKEAGAQLDWPFISDEIRRLLSVYGERSSSFRHYANALLDWVTLADQPSNLYRQPVPILPKTFEVPLYMRLALGQAAVDGVPVPVHLALAWVKLDPSSNLRTPATRCSEQFDKLFEKKYAEAFNSGIQLPRNRTKLQLIYRPASAGFRGATDPKLTFGDIPDVTVLAGPRSKLQVLVESATKDLEPYSRYVGKNPEAKTSLEGLLQLPIALWPDNAQVTLQQLVQHIGAGMVVMTFQELLTKFDAKTVLTRDKTLALARALELMRVGIEPDVLGGAKLPKSEDSVVLFADSDGVISSRAAPSYQIALMTLQLASVMAMADGNLSIEEMKLMREMVQSWSHLAPNLIRRLLAQLRLLVTAPVSLAAIKKKLDPLDAHAKETIAAYMVGVAHSDGAVSPAEVKVLEQVYKALGIDAKKVFSDIHKATSGFMAPRLKANMADASGLKLDHARIAELQQDTEKVSALLANIFKDEENFIKPILSNEIEAEQSSVSNSLLGLDQTHSKLVRVLLSRPQWSREDLLDLTADLELMLDGALERINEAAFDMHDVALIEGDDLMEVNMEILEKIEA